MPIKVAKEHDDAKKSEKSESEMPIEVVRELVNMNKLPPSLQLLPNI